MSTSPSLEALPKLEQLREQLQSVIVGQHDLLERLIIALLSGGHVLLEGPPGLAKTTAVHALATGIEASFQRIQFTPDLMPGELTGSDVFETTTGSFRFVPGPLFHQIVLADEINRAPPKVQSALLEAMAEHQVSVGSKTHPLPELFMVLATQNPLEQAGTYALPEAQLDRFLFHLILDYPTPDEEIEILRRTRGVEEGRLDLRTKPVISPAELLALRASLADVHVEASIEKYIVDLVTRTRNLAGCCPQWNDMLLAGASPRASISLLRSASARALLQGRDYVIPEDVIALAADVLRHRLVLDFNAAAEGITADHIVEQLLERIEAP